MPNAPSGSPDAVASISLSRACVRASLSTVLVVEDDHDVRVSIRGVLEEAGYTVLSVTEGNSALEVLELTTSPPALILLDLKLPVMDGWQVVEHVRRMPALTHIPIVIMS